jgi:hypothetical protein
LGVVGPSGRRLQSKVLETNARVLIDFLRSVPRPRHLCLEEGTHSAWLYEELAPHVDEIVVARPGLGPIRIAQLLPVVVTPYRFSSKRAFWSYAGLGVVMRSSSDWVRAQDGRWVRLPVQQTRGLNRNFNRTMKQVFKGAAMTVIQWAEEDEPLFRHYRQLLDGGTKPNLARLTLARQIASVVLSMWRSEEVYNATKLKTAA